MTDVPTTAPAISPPSPTLAGNQTSRRRRSGGHALVRPTSGIAERVIGAQPVAVYRDEQKILQKLDGTCGGGRQ